MASMAGLVGCRAMVGVGPPLFCSPMGASSGSVLGLELFATLKPQVVPLSMLLPPSVIVPALLQFPPEGLLAIILLVIVTVPPLQLSMPPPKPGSSALFPASVLL